jgi:hypothetical protein
MRYIVSFNSIYEHKTRATYGLVLFIEYSFDTKLSSPDSRLYFHQRNSRYYKTLAEIVSRLYHLNFETFELLYLS